MRRPVSRARTAPSSSSVCRLPFIRSSASPLRTSATARAAAAWLWGASTIRQLPRSIPCALATSWIFADGPTRIGAITPRAAASMAPASADASHGCATAVAIGSRSRHRRSSCSFFPVPGSVVMTRSTGSVDRLDDGACGGRSAGEHFPYRDDTLAGHEATGRTGHPEEGTPVTAYREFLRRMGGPPRAVIANPSKPAFTAEPGPERVLLLRRPCSAP